ncbi:MAG: 1-(5-phosphoribosyl)-5-[(5-phosphoribosylamino)methylideneamino]imidazole-4-carboxamide isomerase [Deltaproteobacteria bacterium]
MLIIPAIDLKDGSVVRLFQGKSSDVTVYSRNPVTVARHWQKQGAELIHIVDLDGAFEGEPRNLEWVKKICKTVDVPIEFGGGIRDIKTIETLFAAGVDRAVLGTKAVEDKDFLASCLQKFGDKVIVSIDCRNGMVLTKGWRQEKELPVIDFALSLREMGLSTVIYTDTSKDGTMRGPDFDGINALLGRTRLKVIASGGVSSIEDICKLAALSRKGLEGAIVGKALYEEKFTLKEALTALKKKEE